MKTVCTLIILAVIGVAWWLHDKPAAVRMVTRWFQKPTPSPKAQMQAKARPTPEFNRMLHNRNSVTLPPTGAIKSEHWQSTLDETPKPVSSSQFNKNR